MSRATLVIDGKTELDDELSEWHKRPPELLVDLVQQGAQRRAGTLHTPLPQPWLVAATMALTTATLAGKGVHIDIKTHIDGWNLTVSHPNGAHP